MVTAAEYAGAPATDPVTFFGMRVAMLEAVKAWHASPVKDADTAKRLIGETVRSNAYLKAAGTQEFVAKYYENVIGRQSSPDNVVKFLEAIPADKVAALDSTLTSLEAGGFWMQLPKTIGLAGAAGAFSKAANQHLGINQLTTDFIATMKQPELLKDVQMGDVSLTAGQRNAVSNFMGLFRAADWLEEFMSVPPVRQMIGDIPQPAGQYGHFADLQNAAAKTREHSGLGLHDARSLLASALVKAGHTPTALGIRGQELPAINIGTDAGRNATIELTQTTLRLLEEHRMGVRTTEQVASGWLKAAQYAVAKSQESQRTDVQPTEKVRAAGVDVDALVREAKIKPLETNQDHASYVPPQAKDRGHGVA